MLLNNSYPYITTDNRFNRQHYMYSSYQKKSFLCTYTFSRDEFIAALESRHQFFFEQDGLKSAVQKLKKQTKHPAVLELSDQLIGEYNDADRLASLNKWIHRFEIHKRMYTFYDEDTSKPVDADSFLLTEPYVAFSAVLACALEEKFNLKVLNTLLKLTDTILSFITELSEVEAEIVFYILIIEKANVRRLIQEKGLVL